MSNNSNTSTQEDKRQVMIGMIKFIASGVTVTAALIGIGAAISRARTIEPTYIYTIPYPTTLSPPVQDTDQDQTVSEGIQYEY